MTPTEKVDGVRFWSLTVPHVLCRYALVTILAEVVCRFLRYLSLLLLCRSSNGVYFLDSERVRNLAHWLLLRVKT